MIVQLPELHSWQERVLNEARRFNVLACGRRWGKTTLAEDLLINPALDGLPVAYFAPTYRMLDEFWRIVVSICTPITTARNATLHRIDLITGGIIDMWSLTEPNVARGRKYARAVVDEAAMIDRLVDAWSAVIRPTLTDYGGDGWFLSTPNGHNDFEKLHGRSTDDADWQSWQRPTEDNPHIDPGEIAALRRDLGERYASQEVGAEFIDANDLDRFLPSILWWDACRESLPTLTSAEPLVLAADAGVSNDSFGLVGVSRHPLRPDDLAVRLARVWVPPKDGKLDFDAIQQEIETICEQWNVAQWCYDPYQLHQMAGSLMHKGVVWVSEFGQQTERLEADKGLLDLITTRRVAHDGNAELRQHLDNADRKPDVESRKLRIVKRSPGQKVDLAVAAAMACKRCLELNV